MDLSSLRTISVFSRIRHISIDNNVFHLHSNITVTLLLLCCLLISTKQFFGEPIKCVTSNDKMTDALNSYCWIHGTFTYKNTKTRRIVGKNAASIGVGPRMENDEENFHMYYQWVCVMLYIQAIMFYMPRYIWKILEGGRLQMLTEELDCAIAKLDSWNEKRKKTLLRYFIEMNGHNFYVLRFIICELLNFANVIIQILLLNSFLDGSFSDYGLAVLTFFYSQNIEDITNPMAETFPKVTKCSFEYFGSSGTLQKLDVLCVLSLNVLNEKIFIVLWFWFIVLAVISGIGLFYRFIMLCCPVLRVHSLKCQSRMLPRYKVKNIVKKFSFSDIFLLQQLGKNLNPIIFKELLLELESQFEKKTAII